MNAVIGLVKHPLTAGAAAVAVARARNLAWWEIALSFPLGVVAYLVSEWTSLLPVSNKDGAP